MKFLVDIQSFTVSNGAFHKGENLSQLFKINKDDFLDFIEKGTTEFAIKGFYRKKEVLIKFSAFTDKELFCEVIDTLLDLPVLKKTIEDDLEQDSLFSEIFNHSPIGLVLVGDDFYLYKANKYIFNYFNLEYEDVRTKTFGNTFLCSNVEGTEHECGTTEHCKNCTVRNNFKSVILENKIINDNILEHTFTLNNRKTTKYFQISASPVKYEDKTFALVSFVDISKRIHQENKLKMLGFTDELTRLNNRRYLVQLLETYFEDRDFDNLNLSIIDIDDFKHVNDTYGHNVGDDVLIALADSLNNYTRKSDHVGRYGGEEFLIILPNSSVGDAKEVIDRVRHNFQEKAKAILGEECSFSAGLVQISTDYQNSIHSFIDASDQLLYEVKAHGKGFTSIKVL